MLIVKEISKFQAAKIAVMLNDYKINYVALNMSILIDLNDTSESPLNLIFGENKDFKDVQASKCDNLFIEAPLTKLKDVNEFCKACGYQFYENSNQMMVIAKTSEQKLLTIKFISYV